MLHPSLPLPPPRCPHPSCTCLAPLHCLAARLQNWATQRPTLTQRASLVAQPIQTPPAIQETRVRSLDLEDPLEKGTATHSLYSCLENGQRSLAGYSLWGLKESDTTEWLTLSLSGPLKEGPERTPEQHRLTRQFLRNVCPSSEMFACLVPLRYR